MALQAGRSDAMAIEKQARCPILSIGLNSGTRSSDSHNSTRRFSSPMLHSGHSRVSPNKQRVTREQAQTPVKASPNSTHQRRETFQTNARQFVRSPGTTRIQADERGFELAFFVVSALATLRIPVKNRRILNGVEILPDIARRPSGRFSSLQVHP